MPWHVTKQGNRWCVIKDDDGANEGCHDSRAKANNQMAALYANERSSVMPGETSYRSAELVYRDQEDGHGGVLEGRMIPYGTWTEIRSVIEGHFMERVMPGALTKTLSERGAKLRVLFEHGFSKILDVQPIAALEDVREEDDGPYYRANLLQGLPDILMSGLRAGLYGTSIAMRPLKGDVTRRPKASEANPEGIEERSITEAFLKEISVVTFPAYEGATAAVRSLTDHRLKRMIEENPALVLDLMRTDNEVEPPHSEPTPQEEPAGDTGSRDTQPETETRKQPEKDWLAPTEEKPGWRLP